MSDYFQLKSFSVRQDRCAMKVGTDAILLGSWASSPAPTTILDIGTGTGIIALMLAQRFSSAIIDAVEFDQNAASQAKANFEFSQWNNRLTLSHTDVQSYRPNRKYDLILARIPRTGR